MSSLVERAQRIRDTYVPGRTVLNPFMPDYEIRPGVYIHQTDQRGEDMDADEAIEAEARRSMDKRLSSMPVEQWIKTTLRVEGELAKNRFLVFIGRLVFPVPYEMLAKETGFLLENPDGSKIDPRDCNMLVPRDKKKEDEDEAAVYDRQIGEIIIVKRPSME